MARAHTAPDAALHRTAAQLRRLPQHVDELLIIHHQRITRTVHAEALVEGPRSSGGRRVQAVIERLSEIPRSEQVDQFGQKGSIHVCHRKFLPVGVAQAQLASSPCVRNSLP